MARVKMMSAKGRSAALPHRVHDMPPSARELLLRSARVVGSAVELRQRLYSELERIRKERYQPERERELMEAKRVEMVKAFMEQQRAELQAVRHEAGEWDRSLQLALDKASGDAGPRGQDAEARLARVLAESDARREMRELMRNALASDPTGARLAAVAGSVLEAGGPEARAWRAEAVQYLQRLAHLGLGSAARDAETGATVAQLELQTVLDADREQRVEQLGLREDVREEFDLLTLHFGGVLVAAETVLQAAELPTFPSEDGAAAIRGAAMALEASGLDWSTEPASAPESHPVVH